jgi:DNA-3-methyladenine glycosylase I
VKLFKKHFKFVGGEIVGEFLMSIGLLEGAHRDNFHIYRDNFHIYKKIEGARDYIKRSD